MTLPDLDSSVPVPVLPPRELLIAAGAVVALSGVLLLGSSVPVHFAGYLLGTAVTIILISAFYREDLERRQSSSYVSNPSLNGVAVGIACVGFAFALSHVWSIARAWT